MLVDDPGLADRWADDRMAIGAFHCLELRDEQRHVVRRVFGVEQQPVVARLGANLDRVGIGERLPEADLRAAQAALQGANVPLNFARVTAPISGRIGRSSVTRGALVTSAQAAP